MEKKERGESRTVKRRRGTERGKRNIASQSVSQTRKKRRGVGRRDRIGRWGGEEGEMVCSYDVCTEGGGG